jgi:hypothetical protein
VHALDRHGALAHCGGTAIHRTGAHVTGGKNPRPTRLPLLLGATTLAKDLLLNPLEIPVAGPGFVHVDTPDHGFDESWAREMTSERKEIVFRAGNQRTIWRRLSNSQSNDAWDLACMTLILTESMKLRLSEMKPDYYKPKSEQSGGNNGQPRNRSGVHNRSTSQIPTFGRLHQSSECSAGSSSQAGCAGLRSINRWCGEGIRFGRGAAS